MNRISLFKGLLILTAIITVFFFLQKSYFSNNLFKEQSFDLDENTIPEIYRLKNGRLEIWENSRIIWQSDSNWRVDDFILKDVTNDGKTDLNLSVWKSGSYGKFKPFWIKQNDMSIKNHFFVFAMEKGQIKPIWQSSNLAVPNCRIAVEDIDEDNKNELVTIEGEYSKDFNCVGEYLAVWKWNGWGLSNEWRSEKGKLNYQEITLAAVGDISFSRGVEWVIRNKKDVNYPFSQIRDYLEGNDIVFGNLETPITEGREIGYGEMLFRSNPGSELALKDAGFTIVNLANNHTPDFGGKGLSDTFDYLKQAGIRYIGAGENNSGAYKAEYLEVKGISVAFLAFTDPSLVPKSYEAGKNSGTAFMDTDRLITALGSAKQKADIVIVSMHSGSEYTNKANDFQINFAHAAIDNGADLVIGHHPHVVQTLEKYNGKYIFYSLGNFVMDQMWSRETREGLILSAKLTRNGVESISLKPVVIENYSQPRIAAKEEGEKILKRLNFPIDSDINFNNN